MAAGEARDADAEPSPRSPLCRARARVLWEPADRASAPAATRCRPVRGWGNVGRTPAACGLAGEGLRESRQCPRCLAWLVPRLATSWGGKPAAWPGVSAAVRAGRGAKRALRRPRATRPERDRCTVHSAGVCPWPRPELSVMDARWPRPLATARGLQDAPRLPRRWVSAPRLTPPATSQPVTAETCPRPAAPRPSQSRRDSGGPGRPISRPILKTGQRRRRRRGRTGPPDPREGTSRRNTKPRGTV